MDEQLTQMFKDWLQVQVAKEQAEAQKAAPQYVTADDLKNALAELTTSLTDSVKALVKEAVEEAAPVRPEGAGRAGAEGSEDEAEKAKNPIAALVSTPVDQLTSDQKAMKAEIIRAIAIKGMKNN